MMEEVKITPILKFTVPKTFMLEGMKEWHLRAHHYIEPNTDNTALYVKGLANAKDGTMQLVEFTRSREFNEVLRKHPVVVSRPATPPPVPSVTLHMEFSTWTHTLLEEEGREVALALLEGRSILRMDAYLEIQGAKFKQQPRGQTRSFLLHDRDTSGRFTHGGYGPSLLTQLTIPGEGPSLSMQDEQQGETLFKQMAVSLEE
ncbi:hypothetical protein DFH08DRAFT_955880 [Mycena albidolilacea]|uniref:Uncharacterized protein n=1 Tax=Mycena albidolilacea TaxID=1033008 RepID=A0AAD7ACW2_9AGAR|nr:hypothetical protein DFH08DRAFT_955880 [Mycena albidolilacea]